MALQPDVYEASASVYVDASSVLAPALSGQIVTADVATQLNFVREALLGRDHLRGVATNVGMFPPEATEREREQLVSALRENIVLITMPHRVPTDYGDRPSGSSTITFSYRHQKPQTAEAVVQAMLESLRSGTATASAESADTVEQFIRSEMAAVETQLRRIEQERAAFLRTNADRLPGSAGSYVTQTQTLRDELLTAKQELRRAESRRDFLRTQLTSASPVVAGAFAEAEPPPNSLDARIRDQAAQCDRLLLRYRERHLDVQDCQASLATLREQRAGQLRAMGITNPDQELSRLASNPVYQAVQIDLTEAETEVIAVRADIADREERLASLQALIEDVPEVEAEHTRLTRDYESFQQSYNDLNNSLQRQLRSRNALETDEVEFTVLEPPRASFQPVAPERLKLIALVFFCGLTAAAGLCYVLAQAQPVVGAKRMLRELTGLPVLGAVSYARAVGRFGVVSTVVPVAACYLVLAAALCGVAAVELLGPGWQIPRE